MGIYEDVFEHFPLGHSERRTLFHETSDIVAKKTKVALDAGLKVILCVGETLEEREAGETTKVVSKQLQAVTDTLENASYWGYVYAPRSKLESNRHFSGNIVIAYEPVWAIGTGKVATAEQAQEAHDKIRHFLETEVTFGASETTRIIYGGSVTATNCKELGACNSSPVVLGFNSYGLEQRSNRTSTDSLWEVHH